MRAKLSRLTAQAGRYRLRLKWRRRSVRNRDRQMFLALTLATATPEQAQRIAALREPKPKAYQLSDSLLDPHAGKPRVSVKLVRDAPSGQRSLAARRSRRQPQSAGSWCWRCGIKQAHFSTACTADWDQWFRGPPPADDPDWRAPRWHPSEILRFGPSERS